MAVKNVCFKCNNGTGQKNRVSSPLDDHEGIPQLTLQHGQEVALCHNETGHYFNLFRSNVHFVF